MYFLAQFGEQLTLHMDVPKLENRTYKSFLVLLCVCCFKVRISGFDFSTSKYQEWIVLDINYILLPALLLLE